MGEVFCSTISARLKGRDDTEVKNGIFPRIARPEELQ